MQDYQIPSFYFSGKFNRFIKAFRQENSRLVTFNKGDYLSTFGIINNTAYLITKGVMMFSLSHEKGVEKTISLFGPGSIFPIGVERHRHKMDFEMIMRAFTDLEVYAVSYQTLRKMASSNPDLAMALLEEDCDFISYLFYNSTSQAFSSCRTRICDTLYVSLTHNPSNKATVEYSQSLLTMIVGASAAQVERVLKQLRDDGVISTSRQKITITDKDALIGYCSDNVQNSL